MTQPSQISFKRPSPKEIISWRSFFKKWTDSRDSLQSASQFSEVKWYYDNRHDNCYNSGNIPQHPATDLDISFVISVCARSCSAMPCLRTVENAFDEITWKFDFSRHAKIVRSSSRQCVLENMRPVEAEGLWRTRCRTKILFGGVSSRRAAATRSWRRPTDCDLFQRKI